MLFLSALRQAGLVSARKAGLRVFYSIAGDDVAALLSALREVSGHRVAEVERLLRTWLAHRDDLEAVPAREVLERAKKGLVVVLDVRPAEEFSAGHLARRGKYPDSRARKAAEGTAQAQGSHRVLPGPILFDVV